MSQGEGRPPLTHLPADAKRLPYATPYTLSDRKQRELAAQAPWRTQVRQGVVWTLAGLAMASGMVSWAFDVAWLTAGKPVWGILGFISALLAAVFVFVGDLVAEAETKPKWFLYAGILSVTSVVFVSLMTVMRR